jgi:signal transduction histidine kinase
MTNVIRHADATEVRVHLENTNEGLLLQVADNGRGISEKQIMSPASYGLLGIRERVHFLGGVVDFSNVHPHGTQVKMFVPSVSGKGAEANRSV